MSTKERKSFATSFGFVLAAAGSAVGLGNIWRFPYLAAKDGGGLFLILYLILALTFGFTLLIAEISIGRKTKQAPLSAYRKLHKKWSWLGIFSCLIPAIILPYYCVIGGWVLKYFITFITGGAISAAGDSFFTDFITSPIEPIILTFIFLIVTTFIIYRGVNRGIESLSKILMPVLLIIVIFISIYSLTLSFRDDSGNLRTGLQGFLIYLIPNLQGLTLKRFLMVLVDAMGQLFFSLSVAMGIMIAYGSYMQDDADLNKSVAQIEIFDTLIAFLAGVMIIPAVFTFFGIDGMQASGPGLLFVTMPKVFESMGFFGVIIGFLFFAMVFFAAITSSVSIMEAVVSSFMDEFNISRNKALIIEFIIAGFLALIVCLGYNALYFELPLPNGSVGQVLDLMDYLSNNLLMPLVAISTCILIGWVLSPDTVIEEVEKKGHTMSRKRLFTLMIKYIAPILLVVLLIQSLGLLNF